MRTWKVWKGSAVALAATIVIVTGVCLAGCGGSNPLLTRIEGLVEAADGSVTYTVTYNGNGHDGGTVPVDETQYLPQDNVTVSDGSALSRDGHDFVGWNTQADGSGTTYNAGDRFTMPPHDVTLHAQWEAIATYTVTYNGNGHTSGEVPTDDKVYENSAVVTVSGPGTMARAGMSFVGWNTKENGSGTTYFGGNVFEIGAENIVLYAQWSTSSYELSVEADTGGSIGAPEPSTIAAQHGVAIEIVATPATGYDFVSWTVVAGTGAVITDAHSQTTTVTLENGDATVRATFVLKTYVLSVTSGSGGSLVEPSNSPVTLTHGQDQALVATPDSGYSFVGWTILTGSAQIASPSSSSTTVRLENGDASILAAFEDNDPPAAPVIQNIVDGTATSSDLVFSLAGIDGSAQQVQYSLDGGVTWEDYVGAVTLTAERSYQITARQSDQAGNMSPDAAVVHVTIDRTDPAASALSLDGGNASTTDRNVSATCDFSDSGSGISSVEYRVDGSGTWHDLGSASPLNTTLSLPQDSGLRRVYVRITDHAGNATTVSDTINYLMRFHVELDAVRLRDDNELYFDEDYCWTMYIGGERGIYRPRSQPVLGVDPPITLDNIPAATNYPESAINYTYSSSHDVHAAAVELSVTAVVVELDSTGGDDYSGTMVLDYDLRTFAVATKPATSTQHSLPDSDLTNVSVYLFIWTDNPYRSLGS